MLKPPTVKYLRITNLSELCHWGRIDMCWQIALLLLSNVLYFVQNYRYVRICRMRISVLIVRPKVLSRAADRLHHKHTRSKSMQHISRLQSSLLCCWVLTKLERKLKREKTSCQKRHFYRFTSSSSVRTRLSKQASKLHLLNACQSHTDVQ